MEVFLFPALEDVPAGYEELRAPKPGGRLFMFKGEHVRLAVRQPEKPSAPRRTPYDVRCPDCGAPPWDPCRAFPGHGVSSVTHEARRKAAEGTP